MAPRLRSLTLAFLLLFFTATILTGLAVYTATHSTIDNLVDHRIANASSTIASVGTPTNPAEVAARVEEYTRRRDTGDLGLLLVDSAGRRLAGNIELRRRLPLGYSDLAIDDGITGFSAGRALVRDIGGGLRLTTIAETEPFDNYNRERIRIYVFGFGSIVVIVVAGVAFLGVIIARRIVEMRRTVEAIIDGDMQRRIPSDDTGSAFDQQAKAFNRMLDRIAELMQGMSHVSNDIAHDLRTPLARLRNQLAAIHRNPHAAEVRDDIGQAIGQSDQLMSIFTAILRIAEIEGGDRRAGFERLNLAALVEDVATMMQPIAEEARHRVAVSGTKEAWVQGDRQLLTQVLINLIENSLSHTPEGSSITLETLGFGGDAIVIVADDGPGIPKDKRDLALRCFGRLDGSRGRAGHGLGLPLVEAVMRLHRGGVTLTDARSGLKVMLRCPLDDGG